MHNQRTQALHLDEAEGTVWGVLTEIELCKTHGEPREPPPPTTKQVSLARDMMMTLYKRGLCTRGTHKAGGRNPDGCSGVVVQVAEPVRQLLDPVQPHADGVRHHAVMSWSDSALYRNDSLEKV